MSGQVDLENAPELCPKGGDKEGLPPIIRERSFRVVQEQLTVYCHCDEYVYMCTRKPTMRETARARDLGIIK